MELERIDNYWSEFFGLKNEADKKSRVVVIPHNYLAGYNGAWIFKRKNQIIISVIPNMVKQIKDKVELLKPGINNVFSEDYLNYLFEQKVERIIGPVYQGYYDNVDGVMSLAEEVVKVSFEENSELIKNLSNTGDEEGWSNSGVEKDSDGIYGYFCKDNIESIGCYKMIKGDVGFVGVYTNPKYRGMGFSQEVLKKMVMELSMRGKLIRYQTLMSNKPSIGIAAKIGFKEYAVNVAIRFENED